MLISGWQQALAVVVMVIPGFVYQLVRTQFRGPTPDDRDLGARVLRALAISALLALVYTAALGPFIEDWVFHPQKPVQNVRGAALLVLLLVFIIPAIVAIGLHVRAVSKLYPELPLRQKFQVYDPTPTAWDYASSRIGPGYVRVLTKDGIWVGGYAGPQSFFTSYPEIREIYVEQAWSLDDDGEFQKPIEGSAGQWIRCEDVTIVQFLLPEQEDAVEHDDASDGADTVD
jgi:hypothetical protein